ncbi:MAG TPA: NAD(P)/FAD-dependent oxidoreductase [Actinomycetes bacterium]|jgi:pyruvate/2-oxoglutarate dehydrogenase complex dihydrolipoamide dehydrogenase (E3) component|nr:NAD(P)/FAD-dependent oxidoreductase [Actinomycetes bacterium]
MGMAADLVVIGGGPAGVSTALRARELGATAALVERGSLGGSCTNDGCVPTRVLAKAARLLRDAGQAAEFGLVGSPPTVDLVALLRRVQASVDRVHAYKDLERHLAWSGVTVRAGTGPARFLDPHTLVLPDGERVEGRQFVICVGGHARRLDVPGTELARTHSEVWSLRRLPPALLVVGGAATGCQLASAFAAFGSRVTILDAAPSLLGAEDADVAKAVAAALAARGVEVVTGIERIQRIERAGDRLRLAYTREGAGHVVDADEVLLAVGWPGNTDGLGLKAAGVTVEGGYVVVDDTLRTSAPHVWAAGDVTGRMMLVQSATAEGRLAAENALLGSGRPHVDAVVPHGGFTDPEYGGVGLTETAAKARPGEPVAVATVAYQDLDRAVLDGRTEGFCKLIAEHGSHRVVGAHVVGEQAVEVVQVAATAMAAGMRVEHLAEVDLAYPTFTAVVGLAARRLARELGAVAMSPAWRALGRVDLAEWERHERA